jgi:hypothetical protein
MTKQGLGEIKQFSHIQIRAMELDLSPGSLCSKVLLALFYCAFYKNKSAGIKDKDICLCVFR